MYSAFGSSNCKCCGVQSENPAKGELMFDVLVFGKPTEASPTQAFG